MFNLQGSEILIILLLALVVLGPEKLPDAMRKAGKFYADLKKMSTSFQDEFRSAMEEPMKEVRETANVLRDSADFTKLQDGDRDEKPKSAEMTDAPVDDGATTGDRGADGDEIDDGDAARPADDPDATVAQPDRPEPFASNRSFEPDARRRTYAEQPKFPAPTPFAGSHPDGTDTGSDAADEAPDAPEPGSARATDDAVGEATEDRSE